MSAPRLNATEKRMLAAFQKEDAQRADVVLAQLRSGEISRTDFRWLIGDDQTPDDRAQPIRPRDFKFRNKFDRWLDARPA